MFIDALPRRQAGQSSLRSQLKQIIVEMIVVAEGRKTLHFARLLFP